MADLKIFNYDRRGITSKTLPEIYRGQVETIKQIYGVDIDVSHDNADGIIQRIKSEFFHDLGQLAESIYNSFNYDYATGAWLESLVSLSNVRRRSATATVGRLQFRVGSNGNSKLRPGERLMVVDSNNVVWYGGFNESDQSIDISDPTTGIADLDVTCGTLGTLTMEATETEIIAIYRNTTEGAQALLTSDSGEVISFIPTRVGSLSETDEELRSRRSRMGTSFDSKTLSDSIVSRLMSQFPILSDISVYNNNTGEDQELPISGTDKAPVGSIVTKIPRHEVAVFVKPNVGTTITEDVNQAILTAIKADMTPGIKTWNKVTASEAGMKAIGLKSASLVVSGTEDFSIPWTETFTYIESQPIDNYTLKITIRPLPGLDRNATAQRIYDALHNASRRSRINQTIYVSELLDVINRVNLSSKQPTFMVLEASFIVGGVKQYSLVTNNGHWLMGNISTVDWSGGPIKIVPQTSGQSGNMSNVTIQIEEVL